MHTYTYICMYIHTYVYFYLFLCVQTYICMYVGSTAAVSKDSPTVEPSTSEQVSEVIPSTPLGDAPIPDQPPTLPPLPGTVAFAYTNSLRMCVCMYVQ